MDLPGLTYRGAALDDVELLERVPLELAQLLAQRNGFVALAGALHVRGACRAPAWHSLREAWEGPTALHRRFPAVRPDDVPFAEEATGDQFLLRDRTVHRLRAARGTVEPTGLGLEAFLDAALRDPIETLGLDALAAFHAAGGRLAPGELLEPDSDGGWKAVPAGGRLTPRPPLRRTLERGSAPKGPES
jgi:hypothetical protein